MLTCVAIDLNRTAELVTLITFSSHSLALPTFLVFVATSLLVIRILFLFRFCFREDLAWQADELGLVVEPTTVRSRWSSWAGGFLRLRLLCPEHMTKTTSAATRAGALGVPFRALPNVKLWAGTSRLVTPALASESLTDWSIVRDTDVGIQTLVTLVASARCLEAGA